MSPSAKTQQCTVSGFTFVKNATKLHYPIKAAIMSVLPIVDEFIVALGDCDEDDTTRAEILSIESDKIRIINTVWDKQKFTRGTIHAQQTDVAKSICKGDWLLYVQADEVIHEKDHLTIKSACQTFITDLKIDGFALDFIHFWG